jgi:hypothetical protein
MTKLIKIVAKHAAKSKLPVEVTETHIIAGGLSIPNAPHYATGVYEAKPFEQGILITYGGDTPSPFPTPKNEATALLHFTAKELYTYLNAVADAAGKDATRDYINGVHLDKQGFTATDGHILKHLAKPLNLFDHNFTIPTTDLPTLLPLLKQCTDTVVLSTHNNLLYSIQSKDFTFLGTIVIGTYPDYTRVIPNYDTWDKHDIDLSTLAKQVAPKVKAISTEKRKPLAIKNKTLVTRTSYMEENTVLLENIALPDMAFDLQNLLKVPDNSVLYTEYLTNINAVNSVVVFTNTVNNYKLETVYMQYRY